MYRANYIFGSPKLEKWVGMGLLSKRHYESDIFWKFFSPFSRQISDFPQKLGDIMVKPTFHRHFFSNQRALSEWFKLGKDFMIILNGSNHTPYNTHKWIYDLVQPDQRKTPCVMDIVNVVIVFTTDLITEWLEYVTRE